MGMGSVRDLRNLRAEAREAGRAPSVQAIGPKPSNPGGAVYDKRLDKCVKATAKWRTAACCSCLSLNVSFLASCS